MSIQVLETPCCCDRVDVGTHAAAVIVPVPVHLRRRYAKERVSIDWCLVPEIRWLWAQDILTLASCCGHGKQKPTIAVAAEDVPKMLELGYVQHKRDDIFVARTTVYVRRSKKNSLSCFPDAASRLCISHVPK